MASNLFVCLFFPHSATARVSSLSRLHDHTQTHHSLYKSSGRVISPVQRRLPTQHRARTRYWHPCPRRNSNPQSQYVRGHRPTPVRAVRFQYTLTLYTLYKHTDGNYVRVYTFKQLRRRTNNIMFFIKVKFTLEQATNA